MEHLEVIIKIGGAVTALGVILGVVYKVWKLVKKATTALSELKQDIDDLKEHSRENYMSLLQLKIMSNEMPIGERIIAGHKYLESGGNGDVKKFLKENFNITEPVDKASHYKK